MCKSTTPFPNRLPGLVECITLTTVATRLLISEPTEEMPQTRPNHKITRMDQMKYVILSHKPTWNIKKSNFFPTIYTKSLHVFVRTIRTLRPIFTLGIRAHAQLWTIGCQVMVKNWREDMPGRSYGMCQGYHLKIATLHWEVVKGNAGGLMSSTTGSINIVIK